MERENFVDGMCCTVYVYVQCTVIQRMFVFILSLQLDSNHSMHAPYKISSGIIIFNKSFLKERTK